MEKKEERWGEEKKDIERGGIGVDLKTQPSAGSSSTKTSPSRCCTCGLPCTALFLLW